MDIVKQHISDVIAAVQRFSKRPDAAGIFKFISVNNTSNFTISDIEDVLDELKHKGKIENKEKKKSLDSFFLVGDDSLFISGHCSF